MTCYPHFHPCGFSHNTYNPSIDDIHNTPGWGIPEDFNDMLNNRSGNQRTSYDEMQDVLDDLADDMSMAVDES